MSGVGALLYADTRSLVNALRDIRRSGGRLALWLVMLAFITFSIALRGNAPRFPRGLDLSSLATADIIASLALLPFAFLLAHGSALAGLFTNRAEAQWIISSPISPFVATVYLQIRQLIMVAPRIVIAFVYLGVSFLPRTLDASVVWRDVALGVLVFTATVAILLPRKLARGPLAALATLAGYGCAVAAAIPLLHDAARAVRLPEPLGPLLAALPAWHPGIILLEPPGPRSLAAGAVLALIALGAIVLMGAAARDAYPELYALSVARIERTGKVGLRRLTWLDPARTVANRPLRAASARAPAGVGIFAWKAWLEYRRRSSPRATALETAGLLAGGFVVARITSHLSTGLWLQFGGMSIAAMLIFTIGFGTSLARELRRPLFWLSDATLVARLAGLLTGHTARFIAWFWLFAVGLASGGAPIAPLVLVAVTEPALLVLLAAVGYLSCAVFPAEIDQRGPLALLRLVLVELLLVPAIVVGVLAGVVAHSAIAGELAATAVALLEAITLLYLAAWRLDTAALPLR